MNSTTNNLLYNERKAVILFTLIKAKKYLYISDIAKKLGISNNNAARQMSKLSGQGYIHRRKQLFDRRNGHKGEYEYRFLKQKGRRVCKELWIRTKLRETDPSVTFNLRKLTPSRLAKIRQQLELQYNQWLQS
jgi:DNA-binding Lrp family transcriptional regulator